jgi:hypothetical protein
MTPSEMVAIAVQASMALLVFCLGMHARFDDLTDLLRHPGLLLRSLPAMNVIMPAFAVAVALLFDLNVVVEAALIAMALSPIPPILAAFAAKGFQVRRGRAGSAVSIRRRLAPSPSRLCAVSVPPCARAILRQMDSPSPRPFSLVVKNG